MSDNYNEMITVLEQVIRDHHEAAAEMLKTNLPAGFYAAMKNDANNFETCLQWFKKLSREKADLQLKLALLREVLHNVQHGNICPAQPGWLDAGPCTCGLDEALKVKP